MSRTMSIVEVNQCIDTDMHLVELAKQRGLKAIPIIPVDEGIRIIRCPNGTEGGKSTVFVQVPLPDGNVVMAQMTVNNFLIAAAALKGWDERDEEIKRKSAQ